MLELSFLQKIVQNHHLNTMVVGNLMGYQTAFMDCLTKKWEKQICLIELYFGLILPLVTRINELNWLKPPIMGFPDINQPDWFFRWG